MKDNISFKMPDGLVIRGTLMGNIESPNLIVMLHSGGYDRREKGVKEINSNQKEYYNAKGNYEYLSSYLQKDAAILLIDQRNHGRSGKNIDEEKMALAIKEVANLSDYDIKLLNRCLKEKDDAMLDYLVTKPNKSNLEILLKKPIVKDMSFLEMADDLAEVLYLIKREYNYSNIHLVGTCMGGLVSTLYVFNHPNSVNSLTLFSPLYTLDSAFLHPDNEFAIHKHEVVMAGGQYKIGNAVEGLHTLAGIENLRKDFYKQLLQINIPIFCIQGLEDKLVLAKHQNAIFKTLKDYHDANNLSPVYYAEIAPGVHCLYDVLYPSLIEATNFISSNLEYPKLAKKPSL